MSEDTTTVDHVAVTAAVVASYVANNSLPAQDLPGLIAQVHSAVAGLGRPKEVARAEPLQPAVPVRRSVMPDFIVCLEDGKKFKSLKRHLRTRYGLTPEQYREKWGLPNDYPMVAPNYARARSDLAKEMGLGQQRRRRRPSQR
ncbi:MucR family transcriptional regulator [Salinarimonas sp. NSM]|uniref:MucR family transcriptional regulator n=1 Tax=Salinarimonas sp. NSM TaxID=3458003 RepID=UPI0040358AFB